MPKFVRIQPKSLSDVAGQVAAGLRYGPAVVPMLGGYCVVAKSSEGLARFGDTFRLLAGPDRLEAELAGMGQDYRERVLQVMAGPVVGRFGIGPSGAAIAAEPLAREVVQQVGGEVWFGVPAESGEPDELAQELGKQASVVVTGAAAGPGPTGVDFRTRPALVDRRGKLAILDLERQLGELVRLGPGLYFSVLVVCTGNSCRSPMAQIMLAGMLEGMPAFVYSAGTAAPAGSPATAPAVQVMREAGQDLTRQRARQLEPEMIRAADLVLVMERHHEAQVTELAPDAAGRTRLLLSYAGSDDGVEDPIGAPVEVYRLVRDKMRPPLERVAAEIRQRAGRRELPEPVA